MKEVYGCCLIYQDSVKLCSKHKEKWREGSPCRTPLLHLKNFPGTPLSRIAEEPVSRMHFIHSNHFSRNPRCSIIVRIAWCSTVSKAFSKSSFRIITSLLDCWHWWIYSKHQAMQSWIVLDLMNPYWLSCSNCSIKLYNLSARILVNNLMLQLSRDMGLKPLTDSKFLTFGTSVMKEWLILSKLTLQS